MTLARVVLARSLLTGPLLTIPLLAAGGLATRAQGQVQLSCSGTLVKVRGNAELKRDTQSLRVSLSLEAEAATADSALDVLERRLATVRQRLQAMEVRDLRVSSPSTWRRPSHSPSIVIEAGNKLLPIEVKATASPRLADCDHLRTFRAEYGNKARAGLLLHTGSSVEWLTPDVLAVPWWRVL